jgi:hypothetical protein
MLGSIPALDETAARYGVSVDKFAEISNRGLARAKASHRVTMLPGLADRIVPISPGQAVLADALKEIPTWLIACGQ